MLCKIQALYLTQVELLALRQMLLFHYFGKSHCVIDLESDMDQPIRDPIQLPLIMPN